jgi:signal transduction histidine kinase
LAQLAAAAHEHLEAFAADYHSRVPRRRIELDTALELMARAVGEARRVIAGLRPTVLDDFGLARAISFEVQALRSEGWQIDYADSLAGERFAPMIETVLFRVAQEALANVRKHANTRRVTITLGRRQHDAYLEVRDWGRGFRTDKRFTNAGPSERVGLVGMRERIALLGGRFTLRSRPGAGTRITVEVPLGGRRTKTAA